MATVLTPIIDTTENVLTIPVSPSWSSTNDQILYSVYVPNLQPEDVVFIETQFELSAGSAGSFKSSLGVGRYIVRTDSPTNVSGTYVTAPVVSTVIQNQFSEVFIITGVDSGMPAGNYYYNVVGYVAGSPTSITSVDVPQGYGDCSVIVFDRP